jgi:hypothetical protein
VAKAVPAPEAVAAADDPKEEGANPIPNVALHPAAQPSTHNEPHTAVHKAPLQAIFSPPLVNYSIITYILVICDLLVFFTNI